MSDKLHTKIMKATGPHQNPSNLFPIGYCIEPPREVLKYAIKEGYRIGGYRQAGQIRSFGDGLVIRGTDMEPIVFGLSITAKLEEIPFSKHKLERDKMTEEYLKLAFSDSSGNLKLFDGEHYISIFEAEKEILTLEDELIMSAAKELVETFKSEPVTNDYLIYLSKLYR
jgi:hypothetical protein